MSKDTNYRHLIGSTAWARLAQRIKREAFWTCSQCGRVTPRLAVHHITPMETARNAQEMERLCFDESNLRVLCYDCHAAVHKSMRKSTAAITQERAKERTERFLSTFLGETGGGGAIAEGGRDFSEGEG